MTARFEAADRFFSRHTKAQVLAASACAVFLVGSIDALTGYELSFSFFYLGPVAVAAWYAGRRAAVFVSILSCAMWYFADLYAEHPYSHPAIPIWNAQIRLGFFLCTGLLLAALRDSYLIQRSLAQTDALTGLFTRRVFEDRLAHDIALAKRRKTALTLAYVDVDNFKQVNDSYGHAEGDRVLSMIARTLSASLRDADTAARLGGDEFALLLPDTDAAGAEMVLERMRAELQKKFGQIGHAVSCSIGAVTIIDATSLAGASAAVQAADALMYEVKRQGKAAVAYRVLS